MLALLFLVLISLWLVDYIHIEGLTIPAVTIFSLNNHLISLWSVLILVFIAWTITLTPSPVRYIILVLLNLWILAVLGILAIADIPLDSIVLLAIIFFIIVSLLRPSDSV